MKRFIGLALVAQASCAVPDRPLPSGTDLSAAEDLATAPAEDLRRPRDLAQPPLDLSAAQDFSAPPDLWMAPDMARPPRTWPSPGPSPAFWGAAYARAFVLTLAADEAGARIYYTLDGTTPGLGSPNGISPVTGLSITAATTVRWFAVAGGATEQLRTDTYAVNTGLQPSAGYLVEMVGLDGTTPTLVAAPGQALTMAKANYQIWVQTACPGCAAQLVYGLDTTDVGCLYNGSPGLYPGVTATGQTFMLTAPAAPGIYEVRVAHIEELSCAAAMSKMALAGRPNVSRIGVLVVR